MKAIVELAPYEYDALAAVQKNLKEKLAGTTRESWFVYLEQKYGYAHYKFSGTISDKCKELLGRMPTANEVIMLVDGGFSHFGATCSIAPNGNFCGRVNTD